MITLSCCKTLSALLSKKRLITIPHLFSNKDKRKSHKKYAKIKICVTLYCLLKTQNIKN